MTPLDAGRPGFVLAAGTIVLTVADPIRRDARAIVADEISWLAADAPLVGRAVAIVVVPVTTERKLPRSIVVPESSFLKLDMDGDLDESINS